MTPDDRGPRLTHAQADAWADALEGVRDDDPDGWTDSGVAGLDDYLYGDADDSGWRA